jgi:purine-binding chemotaxis protein CheW
VSKEQKHAAELMPKNEQAIKILQERANELAKPELNASEHQGISFVGFILNQKDSYGISHEYIQEILLRAVPAILPLVPNFVAGVINWRGMLITVVDLLQFFHSDDTRHHDKKNEQCILIVRAQEITLGLLVQHIEGDRTYRLEQLTDSLSHPEYILGLHHTFTAIINLEALMAIICQEIKMRLYKIGEVHEN